MKSSIIYILLPMLIMLSFSIDGGDMYNEKEVSSCPCEISVSPTEYFSINCNENLQGNDDRFQTYSVSDVELALKTLSESNHSSQNHRLRRTSELFEHLKDTILSLSQREDLLVLDKSRFPNLNKNYALVHSSCSDYFLYTLRRILI